MRLVTQQLQAHVAIRVEDYSCRQVVSGRDECARESLAVVSNLYNVKSAT